MQISKSIGIYYRMKLISYLITILFVIPAIIYSCGSSGYDVEEVESKPDTTKVAVPRPEILEETAQPLPEVKEEIAPPEAKIDASYTVQLGAFNLESNALETINRAKDLFTQEVYYKLIGGLYKVRLGYFSTLPEAFTFLNKVKDAGFPDSFVTEVTQ
jgi:cell division protein FtsN